MKFQHTWSVGFDILFLLCRINWPYDVSKGFTSAPIHPKKGVALICLLSIFFYLFFARFFLYCYWPYGAWLLNFPFISTCHWVFNGSRELEYLFCVLFHHRSSFVGIFFFSSTPFSTKCNRLNDVKGLCCCWYSMLYWACQRLFFFSLPI